MKVALRISSEIDWFDTAAKVSFGDQSVTLKQIQKSINNKTRYVKLGDGTMGILPQEWMERFAEYFRTGEIADDRIRIPKSLYAQVDELFAEEVLIGRSAARTELFTKKKWRNSNKSKVSIRRKPCKQNCAITKNKVSTG